MKINKIITATNEKDDYLQFVLICARLWNDYYNIVPDIAFVTERDIDDPLVKKFSSLANIHLFKPIKEIDSGIQSKVSRMFLAASKSFNDDYCSIVDIDMLPISRNILSVFEKAPDNSIVKWNWDMPVFSNGMPDYGKWAMDKTTAKGSTFSEIINPLQLKYEDLLKSWYNLNYTGRESVLLPFHIFSDESLLRALYESWGDKKTRSCYLSSKLLETNGSGRIDRVNNYTEQEIKNGIQTKKFFECHGKRPFKKNLQFYRFILEALDYDINDFII